MRTRFGYRRRRARARRLGWILCLTALMTGAAVAAWWYFGGKSSERGHGGHVQETVEVQLLPLLRAILATLDGTGGALPEEGAALHEIPWGPVREDLGLAGGPACSGEFFTGVRARIQGMEEWSAPTEVVWGKLYFRCGGTFRVLELTARRSARGFVLTRMWNWKHVEALPEDPARTAEDALKEIEAPVDRPGPPGELIDAQPCFIRFVP